MLRRGEPPATADTTADATAHATPGGDPATGTAAAGATDGGDTATGDATAGATDGGGTATGSASAGTTAGGGTATGGPPRAAPPGTVPVSGAEYTGYLVGIVVLPFVVLAAALPFAREWGASGLDLALGAVMYAISIAGISTGYHRHFTHQSFKAKRPLRIALALAGGMAVEGPVSLWVAEHRRHHQFSDREGDPHSPWAFGTGRRALLRGLWHAQIGWFARRRRADLAHYAPDILGDPDIARLDRWYWLTVSVSFALPPLVGGLWTMSWHGAATAFFWGSLVRYAVVHHVTWSVNSIAHAFGPQHYRSRDQSRDVRWVALLTFGEGWHNLHHADPTSARHGALRGQADPTAALIRLFERAGWAHDVRWPDRDRLATRMLTPANPTME
ncbi:acyl-CoA desaturase [Streptomyces lavendulocolor]|uniref:acyl-CoA desaturase n=1 Tax=Streptomyces lavendulocolor TaxID=67316 RepID=UPI003C30640D